MPECVPRPHRIEAKWRPSGHHARRDEVAATVYVMSDAASDFSHASTVWKGTVKLSTPIVVMLQLFSICVRFNAATGTHFTTHGVTYLLSFQNDVFHLVPDLQLISLNLNWRRCVPGQGRNLQEAKLTGLLCGYGILFCCCDDGEAGGCQDSLRGATRAIVLN